MRRRLRILHTSDVHLEADTYSGPARRAFQRQVERAFARVCELARSEGADLFLIAGDLFDSNRIAEAAVAFVRAELERVPCPVVLIPGNHDCFDERSVYRRFDFREIGPHVFPLTHEEGETLAFDELHATVWGKGLVDHVPHNRPLAGVPLRDGDRWHVGLAHGHFAEDLELRSSLITPGEIGASGLDYLALGHVHVFRDVSQGGTRACYAGTPAPLHGGQPESGSVALVTLDPQEGVTVEERRLSELVG